MREIIEKLPNLRALAGPKSKNFLHWPTMVAIKFKNFMHALFQKNTCPLSSYVLDEEAFTAKMFATMALELKAA